MPPTGADASVPPGGVGAPLALTGASAPPGLTKGTVKVCGFATEAAGLSVWAPAMAAERTTIVPSSFFMRQYNRRRIGRQRAEP